MYIRRKVFSLAVDQETGEEKLFSTTDIPQKEFSEKKAQKDKDTKAEKAAKATTIGGATVGLGASAAGLGAEIGRKKVSKKLAKAEVKKEAAEAIEKAAKDMGMEAPKTKEELIKMAKKVEKLKKADKVLEKASKHAPKAALAGVGASLAGAAAYKLARKKKDQKEFAEKKDGSGEKAKKAGKVMAGVGAATALGGGLAANHMIDNAVTEVAKNRGLEKSGYGVTSKVKGNFKSMLSKKGSPSPMTEAKNILKSSGKYKIAKGTALGGLALGAVGTGTYLYGRHKSKNSNDSK